MDDRLEPVSRPPEMSELLEEDERVDAMVAWFRENFADPYDDAPFGTGEEEYDYAWGGPFYPKDELTSAFDGMVSEEELELAANRLRGISPEWAPAEHRINFDFFDEALLDEGLEALGGDLDQVDKLLNLLLTNGLSEKDRPTFGMGHNEPPDWVRQAPTVDHPDPTLLTRADLLEIKKSIEEIRLELAKPNPAENADKAIVKRAEGWISFFWRCVQKGAAAACLGAVGGAGKLTFDKFIEANPEVLVALARAVSTTGHWLIGLQLPI